MIDRDKLNDAIETIRPQLQADGGDVKITEIDDDSVASHCHHDTLHRRVFCAEVNGRAYLNSLRDRIVFVLQFLVPAVPFLCGSFLFYKIS